MRQSRVAKGEKITITKHGVPVAVLQQPGLTRKPSPQAVITKLLKFRKKSLFEGFDFKRNNQKILIRNHLPSS